jgi:hypothetical protein
MGHDGPGHLAIAEGRPLRAPKLYPRKKPERLSIEIKSSSGR